MGDLGRLLDQLAERIPNGQLSLALGASAFLPEVIEELDRLKRERDEARAWLRAVKERAEAAEIEQAEARAWLRTVMERAEEAERARDEARAKAEELRRPLLRRVALDAALNGQQATVPPELRFPWEDGDSG